MMMYALLNATDISFKVTDGLITMGLKYFSEKSQYHHVNDYFVYCTGN